MANFFRLCLHHYTDYRLRTGLTHQNAAGIAKCLCCTCNCLLHRRVCLCCLLIGDAYIYQYLRVNCQSLRQLTHLFLACHHDFHHFKARQDTVTGARIFTENDMAALLTADPAAIFHHILVNVFVTDCRLRIVNAKLVKCLVQPKV